MFVLKSITLFDSIPLELGIVIVFFPVISFPVSVDLTGTFEPNMTCN
jgi:hypothetical protein